MQSTIESIQSERHVIFGAGLIGTYLVAAFNHTGLSAEAVVRPSLQEKLKHGVSLSDYLGHEALHIPLKFADVNNPISVSYLWLTVKCTAVHQAAEDMRAFVSPSTVILCCQNGLGSDAIIKQAFPDNLVLRVMVPFNVVELKPGHFHRGSQGKLTIELADEKQLDVNTLVAKVRSNLLPVATSADMTALLWAKLQLNLGNSVNALADIPVKAMLQQRAYRRIIAMLMQELLLVTDKLGISLPKVTSLPAHWLPTVLRLPDFLFKRIANKMLAIDPNVRTSMWWDVSQGKKTEIDYLNGAIVTQAQHLGLKSQVNQRIIQLIKAQRSANHVGRSGPAIEAKELLNLVCQQP
ncbi:MAG: 2-dehydropantoate 2-reductase [Paraglaciecola sp.]|nr:2-dehydropantoate 2-reductase [Paraglaciecola sp.]NCT47998.1 2-dehydropantoate 2-reductase [Paraglaciecola sp.]